MVQSFLFAIGIGTLGSMLQGNSEKLDLANCEAIVIVENSQRLKSAIKKFDVEELERKRSELRCDVRVSKRVAFVFDRDAIENRQSQFNQLIALVQGKQFPYVFTIAELPPGQRDAVKKLFAESPFGGKQMRGFVNSSEAKSSLRFGMRFKFEAGDGRAFNVASGPWAPDDFDESKEMTSGATFENTPADEAEVSGDEQADSLVITIRHFSGRQIDTSNLRRTGLAEYESWMTSEDDKLRVQMAQKTAEILKSQFAGHQGLFDKQTAAVGDLSAAQKDIFVAMMKENLGTLGLKSTKEVDALFESGKISISSMTIFMGIRDSTGRGRFVPFDLLIGK